MSIDAVKAPSGDDRRQTERLRGMQPAARDRSSDDLALKVVNGGCRNGSPPPSVFPTTRQRFPHVNTEAPKAVMTGRPCQDVVAMKNRSGCGPHVAPLLVFSQGQCSERSEVNESSQVILTMTGHLRAFPAYRLTASPLTFQTGRFPDGPGKRRRQVSPHQRC